MPQITIFVRRLRRILLGAFFGTIASTIAIIIYGTLSEFYIENPISASGIHSLFESLWWTVQTITTVGYGDVTIIGYWGKLNAIAIMLLGIGSLGVFTASVGANLVMMNLAGRVGERRIRMRDHVIVCNADDGLNDIVNEFNENGLEVVLVDTEDPKESKPIYTFVRGRCSVEKDLDNAGIMKASKVLVFPERGISEAAASDAKTILTSMVIRKMKSDAYIIVQLFRSENREHALMAGANEVIVKGAMSTLLMSSAVTSPGVSRLFYELLKGRGGYMIKEYPVESRYRGRLSEELYREMETEGTVVLGFRRDNNIRVRPPGSSSIEWEYVVVMEARSD